MITQVATIEPGHKIQLPPAWAAELGLQDVAALEKTSEGILIRPYRVTSWDDIFATKLNPGLASAQASDVSETTGDDLLF